MIDIKLILRLWSKSFSLKKGSLRYPVFKRVTFACIGVPLLLIHVCWTHLMLKLDDVFFPTYRYQHTNKTVFIAGHPRSGTSFLLNLLANNDKQFTSFKLWEMVFAPAIVQKIFWLKTAQILAFIGFPVGTFLKKLDGLFFRKLNGIHDLSLSGFEEDELLQLYLFQSVYLIFLFPELEDEHDLTRPDCPEILAKRTKAMYFYQSLVKRHLYVFDKKNERHFLSKNPLHTIRLLSLTAVFPTGKLLVLHREKMKTIPSTISLNQHLYAYFGKTENGNPLRRKTLNTLLSWHQFLQNFLEKSNHPRLNIDFKYLVKSPSSEVATIHDWLGLPRAKQYCRFLERADVFSENYKSRHRYEELNNKEIEALASISAYKLQMT